VEEGPKRARLAVEPVSWLGLHRWIPQRDVRKFILQQLNVHDMALVWEAHTGKDVSELPDAMFYHAQCGHVEVLRRIFQRDFYIIPNWMLSNIAQLSAKGGNIGVLELVRAQLNHHGTWWMDVCRKAARHGHLDVILWVCAQKLIGASYASDKYENIPIMRAAAKGGHVHIMQWFVEECNARLTTDMSAQAAVHGHLEMLQWLYAQGCPTDIQVLLSKDPRIMQWAAELLRDRDK
jgi:hypothetical protein